MQEYCIHGLQILTLKDGSEFYSCSRCNPEMKKMYDKPKYRQTIVGDMCCENTLLHLAETGVIYASVPDWATDEFCEMYNDYKGKDPVFSEYCIHHGAVSKDTKIWYDSSIVFKSADFLNFNKGLTVLEMSDDRLRIYSNEFIRYLFSVGFDIGKSHNIESVLTHILQE